MAEPSSQPIGAELPRAVAPPGGSLEIFDEGIRARMPPCKPMNGGRQVPSGTARVRRTMNRHGKCTGKPAQAVTDFVPPPDPALKGEGVQHKPERKQAAQDQSE
jgi:hypothetical protein